MLYRVMCVALLISQHSFASQVIATADIKYGEWGVDIDMLGLPIDLPTQTQRICLQKDKLLAGTREVRGCRVKWTLHGHKVNWTFQCSNGGYGKGAAIYKWDTFRGYNELTVPGGLLSLQSTLTGKWLRSRCSTQSLR